MLDELTSGIVGTAAGKLADLPVLAYFQGVLAERVGFEPTVRLPVQRFSSSMILVLTCTVQCLNVCSRSAFSSLSSHPMMPGTMP